MPEASHPYFRVAWPIALGTLGSVSDHYRAPGWFTRNVFNQLVAFLTRHGISVLGSRVLAVKGRTSGQWRTTPVNLLTHDGRRYLVAARGETQWARNLRAVGTGELRVGRRAETFRGRELTDDEKIPVLREISLPMHIEAVKPGYAKYTVMQQQAVPSPPTADRG